VTMANTNHAEALAYLTMSLLLQDPDKVAGVAASALLRLASLDE
jgi:hypothetical protein